MSSETPPRRSAAIPPTIIHNVSRQASPLLSAPRPLPTRHASGPSLSLSSSTPRHLLVPTTRVWLQPDSIRNGHRAWHSGGRLTQSRPRSVDQSSAFHSTAAYDLDYQWLGSLKSHQIEVLEAGAELLGFQLFAVEKWVVDRDRPIKTVVVYTGNPNDKVGIQQSTVCDP